MLTSSAGRAKQCGKTAGEAEGTFCFCPGPYGPGGWLQFPLISPPTGKEGFARRTPCGSVLVWGKLSSLFFPRSFSCLGSLLALSLRFRGGRGSRRPAHP